MDAVPGATPVTTPAPLTDATEVLLLLHTPPAAPSVNVVVFPAHIVVDPLMVPALGAAFTVIVLEALTEPQLLITV
jgi:hypothetical protein